MELGSVRGFIVFDLPGAAIRAAGERAWRQTSPEPM